MFVLALEDERSARLYFSALGRLHRERVTIVFAKQVGSDPASVVRAARQKAEETDPDEVWCVFDTEGTQHPLGLGREFGQKVPRNLGLAETDIRRVRPRPSTIPQRGRREG